MSPCTKLTNPVAPDDEKDFIAVYREAFEGAPYFESYSEAEAAEVLHSHLSDGVVSVAREDGHVAGFGCAVLLSHAPQDVREYIGEQIADGSLPPEFTPDNAWYMSELGVLEAFRGRGLAYELVGQRLEAASRQGGKYYFMRTAAEKSNSRHLYEKIGAEQLAAEQDVSKTEQVVSSQSQSTRRIYLFGECNVGIQRIADRLGA